MPITAIEGVVEDGKIRLCEKVQLPENTRVFVIVANQPALEPPRIASPRLANPAQAGDFRKQVVELPADARL